MQPVGVVCTDQPALISGGAPLWPYRRQAHADSSLDAGGVSMEGLEHRFVASMRRMRVHATDHNRVSRSSASRFASDSAIGSPYAPTSLMQSRRACPFCEDHRAPSGSYRDLGSSDPLTKSQRGRTKELRALPGVADLKPTESPEPISPSRGTLNDFNARTIAPSRLRALWSRPLASGWVKT